jgi:hypothetical protein
MPDELKSTVEPDGFRVEYRADTGETALIFALPGPGLLSVDSRWQPASRFTASKPHQRHLIIEVPNAN